MKRFMLFVFSTYYPDGGMNDFVGSFDSYDEAKIALHEKQSLDSSQRSRRLSSSGTGWEWEESTIWEWDFDNYHVYDLEADKIISGASQQGFDYTYVGENLKSDEYLKHNIKE